MTITGPIPGHILSKMNPEDRAPMGKAGMTQIELDVRTAARSEKELQGQVCNMLRLRDILYLCQPTSKRSQLVEGAADIHFACSGIPVALECKVEANTQTEAQMRVEAKYRANGWRYRVVRHIDEVIAILRAIEEEKGLNDAP